MKTVKLTFPYTNWPLQRQLPGNGTIWKDWEFRINDPECVEPDYWFVFEGLEHKEQVYCKLDHTVFLTAEPPSFKKYPDRFLRQFAHIITCQRNISHPNLHFFHQGHPWFIEKSFDQLIGEQQPPKKKPISIVVSNKQITDGHKRRYEFCLQLKEHFQDEIDLYGRGIKDFNTKWEVLAPYKYSVAIENEFLDDWFTEKIYDCFLSYAFPFYYGCPNLQNYFDERSFKRIDIVNFDKSVRIISDILNDPDHYDQHLPDLMEARAKYLSRYNLFPLITNFASRIEDHSSRKPIVILPESDFLNRLSLKKVKNYLRRT